MPQILLCCVLALLLAALGLLLRSLHRRSRPSGGNETLKVLLVCFFICGILLHLPMYAAAYAGEHLSWLKALLGAVHHTLRMFVLDGELDPIHEFAMTQPAVWSDLYFGAAIVVYLVSPLLTFSVVLSFFKNLSAMWRYAFRRCTELYVFSELNEDSLYLAGSIKAAHPKGLIVFTDVYENESEEFGEQMAAAHRLGAACFKADIALLRLRRSDRSRPVYFFLMGRDKAENIHQAVLLTRNQELKKRVEEQMHSTGVTQGNIFAMTATEVAYGQCDPWLDGMLDYLREAENLLRRELNARLPEAVLAPMNATYLGWLDLRAYGFTTAQLTERTHKAGVAFSEGTRFGGEAGEGFLRFNFACPHSQTLEAVKRLEKALKA